MLQNPESFLTKQPCLVHDGKFYFEFEDVQYLMVQYASHILMEQQKSAEQENPEVGA